MSHPSQIVVRSLRRPGQRIAGGPTFGQGWRVRRLIRSGGPEIQSGQALRGQYVTAARLAILAETDGEERTDG